MEPNGRDDYIKNIFVLSLLLSRKWEVLVNRSYGKDELTLKQLLVMIIIGNAFTYDPTIKEVSGLLATSHQNAKALLTQLEKKEFVQLYKDPKDKRVQRIQKLPDKEGFWKERDVKDTAIMNHLFRAIPEEDLATTLKVIAQLDAFATEELNF